MRRTMRPIALLYIVLSSHDSQPANTSGIGDGAAGASRIAPAPASCGPDAAQKPRINHNHQSYHAVAIRAARRRNTPKWPPRTREVPIRVPKTHLRPFSFTRWQQM
jgi:hypothetical protein